MTASTSANEKLHRERHFHDEWALTIDPATLLVEESFEAATSPENRFILSRIGDVGGKRLLDVGCGSGEASVFFALRGAHVVSLDISGAFLDIVEQLASRHEVHTDRIIAPVEALPFPDASFDIVYGNSVLHHLEFEQSMREVHRVLKPGGHAYFIEPLWYNPLINLYRWMAGTMRTPDETPLRLRSVRELRGLFSRVEHREYWLLAQLVFVWFYVGMRVHPNDERYWKKIVYDADKILWLYRPLAALDRILIKIPLLNRMCWNTVMVLRK